MGGTRGGGTAPKALHERMSRPGRAAERERKALPRLEGSQAAQDCSRKPSLSDGRVRPPASSSVGWRAPRGWDGGGAFDTCPAQL